MRKNKPLKNGILNKLFKDIFLLTRIKITVIKLKILTRSSDPKVPKMTSLSAETTVLAISKGMDIKKKLTNKKL